jgi:NAD(P)-dependent dehydrogenase (short-subunit alcohol dehydrogenase family)
MKPGELFDLTGEVAVVVGGTGILGGAIAEGLAEAGAIVAILGRNEERGKVRVRSIQERNGKTAFIQVDSLQKESLRNVHRRISDSLGLPTILVNAAGGNDASVTLSADRSFDQIELTNWQANFDLNLVGGVLLPCQEFCPAMLSRGRGSVINIASVSAHIPLSRVVAYSAAKAAVVNLTQFLSREWAAKGVRVNSITPGFFPGEQNRRLLFNEDGSPTARTSAIWSHTPMGRFGRPDELIGAAIFLAGPRSSSFITGTDIRVDGGFLAQTI